MLRIKLLCSRGKDILGSSPVCVFSFRPWTTPRDRAPSCTVPQLTFMYFKKKTPTNFPEKLQEMPLKLEGEPKASQSTQGDIHTPWPQLPYKERIQLCCLLLVLENIKPCPPVHIDWDQAFMVSLQRKLKHKAIFLVHKCQRQIVKKSLGQQSSMFVVCLPCPLLLGSLLPHPSLWAPQNF